MMQKTRRGKQFSRFIVGGAVCAVFAAGFAGGQWAAAREPLLKVTPLVASGETVMGERIFYPAGSPAKITAAVWALEPGAETSWHTHGAPILGYVIEGEITVDYGERGKKTYKAGDAVLEAMAIVHKGRNTGQGVVRILAVSMGAEGVSVSTPAATK
jgi:quercetin dioxygenase-like cupin family protein